MIEVLVIVEIDKIIMIMKKIKRNKDLKVNLSVVIESKEHPIGLRKIKKEDKECFCHIYKMEIIILNKIKSDILKKFYLKLVHIMLCKKNYIWKD